MKNPRQNDRYGDQTAATTSDKTSSGNLPRSPSERWDPAYSTLACRDREQNMRRYVEDYYAKRDGGKSDRSAPAWVQPLVVSAMIVTLLALILKIGRVW